MTGGSKYVLTALLALVCLPSARASDRDLLGLLTREFRATAYAASAARGGVAGPDAVQRQYNTARDLQIALLAVQPVSNRCIPLLTALETYAAAQVQQAEGYDRQNPTLAARGRKVASESLRDVERRSATCRPGQVRQVQVALPLDEPRSEEAFLGLVRSRAPSGATEARLYVDGRRTDRTTISRGWSTFNVRGAVPSGRHELEVRFLREGRTLAVAQSHSTWLLPDSARRRGQPSADPQLATVLARIGASFGSYSGIVIHDIARGTVARWNADARFPAASTVKLGVLVAALARFGSSEKLRYDLTQLTAWSSNLAANRLVMVVGNGSAERGAADVERVLQRIGASSSSYTGLYRVGTARDADASEPPLVSQRVTTASDLTKILARIHGAAMGDAVDLEKMGLTDRTARLALGLLLGSQPTGDNAGLLRPFIPARIPTARKEGWLRDARHSTAIVYSDRGPVVITVLSYRAGLRLADARRLGRSVVRAAGLP